MASAAAKGKSKVSQPETVAAAAAGTSNEGNAPMQNEAIKEGVDRAQAYFGDVNNRAKAAADKTAKIVEELSDIGRGNMDAFVASAKIAAKGVETLGQEAAEYGRKSFEEASAALRGLAEVKNPADLFRLQGEFAKNAFDSLVAESARMSEQFVKLAGDVAEPLTSRYSAAAERVKTLAA